MDNDPETTVRGFIKAINARNPARLSALMSDDHLFIDASGDTVRGREEMRKAWIAYFVMIPDYRIDVETLVAAGDTVAVFGRARGTYSPDGTLRSQDRWELPAAWRAEARDGMIRRWQVYADNEPVRQIISRYG